MPSADNCTAPKTPDRLAALQQRARDKGGVCLSATYLGDAVRYSFRCAAGHEWQVLAATVLKGTWCKVCAAQSRRLSIADARQAASTRGGECVSAKYVNNRSLLDWKCFRGHVWQATLTAVRNHGSWCPDCLRQDRDHCSDCSRQRYRNVAPRQPPDAK